MCSTNVVDRVTLTVNGKRQIQVKTLLLKTENEQLKTVQNISNSWVKLVKVVKSKRQVKGKHGHLLQIHVY